MKKILIKIICVFLVVSFFYGVVPDKWPAPWVIALLAIAFYESLQQYDRLDEVLKNEQKQAIIDEDVETKEVPYCG